MKNLKNLLVLAASVLALTACGGATSSASASTANTKITVAASELPHAAVLNNAVKPLLEKKGYTLEVTVLDWTLQNDAVAKGDYDANYFQHRPYLEQYNDAKQTTYNADFTYTSVFPTAAVHFEPLSIYTGKGSAANFEANKKTATYEICNDVSNEIRALDLLKNAGVIDNYDLDADGAPTNLPSNIHAISEDLLGSSLADYDYGVLPVNTALTAGLTRDTSLPTETNDVADLRANVVAANVSKYKADTDYKARIDALTDAILDASVDTYIQTTYKGVITTYQKDLRTVSKY